MVSGPVNRYAWAFNDPAFSDVQLVLRAASLEPDNADKSCAVINPYGSNRRSHVSGCNASASRGCADALAGAALKSRDTKNPSSQPSHTELTSLSWGGGHGCLFGQPKTEIRIHAHSIILASCSEMMRSWLSRWNEDKNEEDLDLLPKMQDRRRRRLALKLDMELAPNELAAGEAVVRFMYTQALDGVEDDEELLSCMLLADRWLLPDCVAACAARLQSTPAGSLSWRVRATLLALPRGLSAASPHVAQLQSRAEASLMRTFRCPELILEDPDNRMLLVSLPSDRLQQLLLARQDVQVTSENVILALLSAWLAHNCPNIGHHHHHQHSPPPGAMEALISNCATCSSILCVAGAAARRDGNALGEDGPCTDCGGAPFPGPTGSSGTGREGEDGRDGGVAQGVEGPPELEGLLHLVRYGNLTRHYRTTVAPYLPVLQELRLHHTLLAEASAAATAAAAAATATAAPSAASIRQGNTPSGSPTEPSPLTAVAEKSQPLSDQLSAPQAASRKLVQLPNTSVPEGSLPRDSSLGSGSSGPPAAAAAAPPPPPPLPAVQSSSSSSEHPMPDVIRKGSVGDLIVSPGSDGEGLINHQIEKSTNATGGSESGERSAHLAVAKSSGSDSSRTASEAGGGGRGAGGGQTGRSGCGVLGPSLLTGGTAASARSATSTAPSRSESGWLCTADVAMSLGSVAASGAPSEAAWMPLQLPRRQPYSLFRRIEWTRDVVDVRLHLTGVGGPLLGVGRESSSNSRQLSPPVFLGGYCWHVATRFVPANMAASASGWPTPTSPSSSPPPAVPWSFPPPFSALSPFASAGRLQLQLGVVCSSPAAAWETYGGKERGGDGAQQHHQHQPSPWLTAGLGRDGALGDGGSESLQVASCTVGLMDAAGRTAWQVVQAPCVLVPVGGAGGGGGEAGAGAVGRPNGGGGGANDRGRDEVGLKRSEAAVCRLPDGDRCQWEFWSGLSGLEASWWESGGALTAGGVLRLYCSLTLQA